MYNPKLIQAAFRSLVGVRQPYSPNVPAVISPLSDSTTGVYVDQKHPLVATENLFYSCPNFEPSTYPTWISGGNYIKGTTWNYLGVLYTALNDITGDVQIPPRDTTNWEVSNLFNTWLLQKYDQASINLMAEVFKQKKLLHMGKAILERIQLYRGGGSIHNKIIPQGRAVGFEISVQSAEGLWVIIEQIGIQLNLSQNLPVYMYNSEELDFLGTWIYVAEEKKFKWQDLTVGRGDNTLNCIMKYLDHNTASSYIFVYYEDDLIDGNYALSKQWNCSRSPCAGCDGVDLVLYNQWSRYTTFRNIQFPSSAINSERTLPDLTKASYDSSTNWGMNFSISVRCNLTDFIVRNIYLWTDAFAMQVCKEYLEAIANGVRIGPNPAQTKLSAIAALDEKAPGNWITKKGGYQDSIQSLNLDFSGFSKACMPCETKGKAKRYTM
jgi:hypothetical protein